MREGREGHGVHLTRGSSPSRSTGGCRRPTLPEGTRCRRIGSRSRGSSSMLLPSPSRNHDCGPRRPGHRGTSPRASPPRSWTPRATRVSSLHGTRRGPGDGGRSCTSATGRTGMPSSTPFAVCGKRDQRSSRPRCPHDVAAEPPSRPACHASSLGPNQAQRQDRAHRQALVGPGEPPEPLVARVEHHSAQSRVAGLEIGCACP